nr:hypothetical protein [Rubripirellula sp.]
MFSHELLYNTVTAADCDGKEYSHPVVLAERCGSGVKEWIRFGRQIWVITGRALVHTTAGQVILLFCIFDDTGRITVVAKRETRWQAFRHRPD